MPGSTQSPVYSFVFISYLRILCSVFWSYSPPPSATLPRSIPTLAIHSTLCPFKNNIQDQFVLCKYSWVCGLTRGYTLRENWLCSQQLTVSSKSSFLGWDFMPRVPLHAGIWFSFGLQRSCVCHHKLLWIYMDSFLLWQKILFPHSHSSPLVLKLILPLLLLWALSLRRRECSIYVSFRVEHSTVSYFLCLS